jgi:FMN-dependent NADH-azoreductase
LRAYFDKQDLPEENLRFVRVEMTMAGLVPHLAAFRSLTETSLAASEAEIVTLATHPDHGDCCDPAAATR